MITIRRKKRIFEGETGQQATQGGQQAAPAQGTNYSEVPASVNTFLATLFDNIKKACSWDAMTKAIPVLANEQDATLKDSIGKLKTAAADFFQVEVKADNADSIKAASEKYGTFITALTEFNTAAAKVAQETSGQQEQAAPAQGAQQQAQAGQLPTQPALQQAAPAQGTQLQTAPAQGTQQQTAPAAGQQPAQ